MIAILPKTVKPTRELTGAGCSAISILHFHPGLVLLVRIFGLCMLRWCVGVVFTTSQV